MQGVVKSNLSMYFVKHNLIFITNTHSAKEQ